MGLLISGKWHDKWYDTDKSDGKFIRQESKFRDYIGSSNFPVRIKQISFIYFPCLSLAHRTAIFRELKELQNIISISAVNPYMGERVVGILTMTLSIISNIFMKFIC